MRTKLAVVVASVGVVLQVGTEIQVEGYQAKDGTNKAVGRNFVLADGTRLFLGGSAPGGGGDKK